MSTWSGPRHEHHHSIRTTVPVEISGKVVSLVGYRLCACGHRVPAAVTEIPGPRTGGNPCADYAEMPRRLHRSWLRGGGIPLAWLAALLFAAGLCLIQPAGVRWAASAWRGGKWHRSFGEISALPRADLRPGHFWPVWGGLVRQLPIRGHWRLPY